ncbi:MAG: inositol monophosphatase family protein [Chromatiales bacterium]
MPALHRRKDFLVHPMVNIAVRAARRAGDIMLRYVDRAPRLDVDSKGLNDFVTEVDHKCEAAIIETLHKAYPAHSILAEESGLHGQGDYQWVIDPLDGTTNFLHGFPQFAVSIALKHKGQIEHGVVYDPLRQELFTATRGQGALLNERRMRVSKQRGLQGALLGTGFPFRENANIDTYLATLKALMQDTAGIRRAGAASLDLAYVACGRLDGFWEFGLKEWDMAAGAVLILEAGGMVGDLTGGSSHLESGNILAANPRVFEDITKVLAGIEMRRTAQPQT